MNKYTDVEIQTAENLLKEGYKWIARNKSGRLTAHAAKPSKVDTYWWAGGYSDCTCDYVPIFQNIRFNDKEPTSLEAIVHPQILDDVERKYLSAFIKPFRDRVKHICRVWYITSSGEYHEYQRIYITLSDDSYDIYLPLFKKETMYKGMELNRKYTLKDLGL